jgi:hypothetical protein
MNNERPLVSFEEYRIRRFYDEQKETWYFSVVDVVGALTESGNPAVYWRVLKKRLKDEGANETVTKCNALKMPKPGRKAEESQKKPGWSWNRKRASVL